MYPLSIRRRDFLKIGAMGALGSVLPSRVLAEEWPDKSLRILVGYAPGGTADNYARAIGQYYQKILQQTVIVDNRPGGAGMIAMGELAKSDPDGHTLALSPTSVYWGNRAFYKKMPFDPDLDVQPYSLLPAGPTILAVPTNSRFQTATEFIDWAKKNPATIGTYSQGSTAHILIDILNRNHGTTIEPIHYRGESPMWVDTVAGSIDAAFGTYPSMVPMLEAKRLRPLAQTTMRRSPRLPDTPTFVDIGIDDEAFRMQTWTSLVAPASTPVPILERLAQLAHEFADTPEGLRFRDQYGIEGKPMLYAETLAHAKTEAPIWIELAKGLGLPPQ